MLSQELLTETLGTTSINCWERDQTPTPVRAFAAHLHATGCSMGETREVCRLFGIERSNQAIFSMGTSDHW